MNTLRVANAVRSFKGLIRSFHRSVTGQVAMMFALASLPLAGAVGAGIDFAGEMKSQEAMQDALDHAALAIVKQGSTMSSSDVQTSAQNWFNSSFKEKNPGHISISATYDATKQVATVNGSATYDTTLLKLVGVPTIPVKATATAMMVGRRWPICVMVTAPASNHTLLTMNGAQINFNNCMVQVNTQNWDAVEARDTSYIHSMNGDNCFVGDIHYGDILPAKDPNCTFFTDPFQGYTVNAPATCDHTNMTVMTATTLQPGTYCNNLTVKATTTFAPGVYYIKGGVLKLQGTGITITATGVTFILTGNNPYLYIDGVTLNQTPAGDAVAGNFGGFLFFLDPNAPNKNDSTITNGAQLNMQGIVYLVGEKLILDKSSVATINTGSVIADFILPNNHAVFNMTGDLAAHSSAEIALQKSSAGNSPVLVQ